MKKRIFIGMLAAAMVICLSAFVASASQEGVYCPHCDQTVTDWTEWTASASGSHSQTAGGHYYLAKDFTGMGGRYGISSGSETVVLDLRGHHIESTNNRCFFVSSGTLAIMDSVGGGTMTGARDGDGNLYVAAGARINMYGGTAKTSRTAVSSATSCGSVLYVLKGGEFNLYGGTLDGSAITTRNTMSGTACVKGTMNIYGGTVTGGNSTNGGNIYMDGGILNMTGGRITGGQAVNGGNIYAKNSAVITVGCDAARGTVATVSKGHATTTSGLGGNMCINSGCTVNLAGGNILDGISDARGGNISNGGANTYNITAGKLTGGKATTDGHNLFVNNGSVALNISGGYVDGGMDVRLTPNISLSGNPVITDDAGGLVLQLGTPHAKVKLGTFTEGANVAISANQAFTDALENAEGYLNYIRGGTLAQKIVAADGKLTAQVICPHCNQTVTWQPWEDVISSSHTRTTGGHYYLTGNISGAGRYKVDTGTGEALVLDLRGYRITSTNDRIFYMTSGNLAIVDSVGTGSLVGSRNGDGIIRVDGGQVDMYGGTVITTRTEIPATGCGSILYVGSASATFNLHGGTLYGGTITTPTATSGTVYTKGTFSMTGGRILNGYSAVGGNVYVSSTGKFFLKGGQIAGGRATGYGGNVHVLSGGSFTMTGGKIYGGIGDTDGNDDYNGDNVYVAGTMSMGGGTIEVSYDESRITTENDKLGNGILGWAKATVGLGGDATVLNPEKSGNIYVGSTGSLQVSKTFTGKASVAVNAYYHLSDPVLGGIMTGNDVCDGPFSGELYLEGNYGMPRICGTQEGKLLVGGIATVNDMQGQVIAWCGTPEDVICNYAENTYIKMYVSGSFLLPYDVPYRIDLNGKTLAVSGTGSVTFFDSSNDTFQTYGSVTLDGPTLANATLTQVCGKDYVALQEGDAWSFHRLEMGITNISLRPSVAGFYYTGKWQMDQTLAANIYQFGVAVSTAGAPTQELMAHNQLLWTQFRAADLQNGTPITGAMIENIFKEGEKYNDVRGRTSVFGATYLALTDGTVLISDNFVNYSLYDLMKLLDESAYAQNEEALNGFYQQWKSVLAGWNLQNIGKNLLQKNGMNYLMGEVLYATDFENDTVGQLPEGWSAGLYGGPGVNGTSFGWTGSGATVTAQVAELEGYGKVYEFRSGNADAFTAMPRIETTDYLYEAELYVAKKGGMGLANNFYAPTNEATGVLFTSMYPDTDSACKYTYKGQPSNKAVEWETADNPSVGEVVKLQILSLDGKNYIFSSGKLMAVCDSRAGGAGADHPGVYTCGGGVYVLSVKVTEVLSAQIDLGDAQLGYNGTSATVKLTVSADARQPFFRQYLAGSFQNAKFGAMVLVADTDVSATLDETVTGAVEQYFTADQITFTGTALELAVELPVPEANYEKWYCIRPFVVVDDTRIYSQGGAWMPVNLANGAYLSAQTNEEKQFIEAVFGNYPGFFAGNGEKTVTFTLFSDFHYKAGMYPATIADLNTILKRADDSNSAFILSAGDFTNDAKGSPELFKAYLNYTTAEGKRLPAYNIYGNHELEAGNTMADVSATLTNDQNVFWGTADGSYAEGIGYYCFQQEGFRIVCLDSEYSFNPTTGQYEHNKAGSSGWPAGNTKGGSLGPEQLKWLEAVLMDAASQDIPCIVVAHDGFSGLGWATTSPDAAAIRAIYRKANALNPGTVVMSINGHIHTNHQGWNEGVFYFDTNTVRNAWWQETAVNHYGDEHTFMYEEYDELGNLLETYARSYNTLSMGAKTWFSADPLSCVITVSTNGVVTVDGTKSDWAYGIAPTTTADGVMCEISSGTFWDCSRYGHILDEKGSCQNSQCEE